MFSKLTRASLSPGLMPAFSLTLRVSTIWPLFGMSNQLLAACGLIIATTMLIRLDRARYAWITAVPGLFMAVTTLVAGYLGIVDTYLPRGRYLLAVMGIAVMILMVVVMVLAVLVGTAQGGIQALSRSFFGKLVPPESANEFFGFYDIFSKFSAVLGPFLFGLVWDATQKSYLGVVPVLLMFIVGGGLFLMVPKRMEKLYSSEQK